MITAKIVALVVLGALVGYLSCVFYTASFDITTWDKMGRVVGIMFMWVGTTIGGMLGSFKK